MWPPEGSSFHRLSPEHQFKPFTCGTEDWHLDLKDFFLTDSKDYQAKLLAVTYILEDASRTIAFYSVSNDRISVEDGLSQNQFKKKIRALFPGGKQLRSYPAVKIGRLGVHSDFQGQRIGTQVLDFIKATFVTNNRTGCRFITVDAYNNPRTLKFYTREGFEFLTTDLNAKTRSMYFDLEQIALSRDELSE